MRTKKEMKDNERSSTEQKGIGRRDFLEATGLATVALGVSLDPGRTFAQTASSPAKAPARELNSYKPHTSNYKQVHKDLLVIDGCTNLVGLDKDPQYIDWYKEGGATAIVLTVSSANMVAASNARHKDETLGTGVHRPPLADQG